MYEEIHEDYRLLSATIIELAAYDYMAYYWKFTHLDKPKYREEWTKKHLKSCPSEERREIEWRIHREFVRQQKEKLEEFFYNEMPYYVELKPDWFVKRLRTKVNEGRQAYYETSRKPMPEL